jgi:hypothetical protein
MARSLWLACRVPISILVLVADRNATCFVPIPYFSVCGRTIEE